MESIISNHLTNESIRDYASLSSYLPFKLIYNRLIYGNIICSEKILINNNYLIKIHLPNQIFTFPRILYQKNGDNEEINYGHGYEDDDEDEKIRTIESENHYRSIDYDNGIVNFKISHDKIIKSLILTNEFININLSSYIVPYFDCFDNMFFVSYDGKLLEVKYLKGVFISISKNKINLINPITSRVFDSSEITEAKIQAAKEFYHNEVPGGELILEFHSDNLIKKYGKITNNIKEGFFYDSDEFGNFEVSCYINDKLHGYYFSKSSKTQGFYEDGVKVGFWKEQGRIINYDSGRARIFFILPVFIF